MKKYLLITSIFCAVAFTSCKNENKNDESEIMNLEESDMQADVNTPQIACFKYASEKDTVLLQMEQINEEVAGTLSYNYFEKDKNDGTFEGKMIGDTLYADYTFSSEGSVSVREVMFVNKDKKLIEGFAEVEEVNGKMKFKDNAKFILNDGMALIEINCDEN